MDHFLNAHPRPPSRIVLDLDFVLRVNGNAVPDACEIRDGLQGDTDADGLLEPSCESVDCNGDAIEDFLQPSPLDADVNGVIDSCEAAPVPALSSGAAPWLSLARSDPRKFTESEPRAGVERAD